MVTYQITYRDGSQRQVKGNALVLREYMAEILGALRRPVAFIALDLVQEIVVVENQAQ